MNVPADVGVPVMVAVPEFAPPDVNVKPAGAAAAEMVGVGTPVAVMLNVAIGVPTVNPLNVARDVNAGGTGVGDGVNTLLAADAGPGPFALVAITVHV